jgi:hypothetical protein
VSAGTTGPAGGRAPVTLMASIEALPQTPQELVL